MEAAWQTRFRRSTEQLGRIALSPKRPHAHLLDHRWPQRRWQNHVRAVLPTEGAGRSYLRLVSQLRAAAWRVELIYLALPDRTVSHQRVAERVSHGGHDIPAADIERRFARSLQHLFHDFSERVDTCRCYMNRGPAPELVFEQTGTHRVVHHAAYYEQSLSQVRQ